MDETSPQALLDNKKIGSVVKKKIVDSTKKVLDSGDKFLKYVKKNFLGANTTLTCISGINCYIKPTWNFLANCVALVVVKDTPLVINLMRMHRHLVGRERTDQQQTLFILVILTFLCVVSFNNSISPLPI